MNQLFELLRGNAGDEGDGRLAQRMQQIAPKRESAPPRCSYQDILDEQAEADRATAAEFKSVLRVKMTTAAAQRNWGKAQRLAASATELEKWR